jgi:hypothetical protein
MIQKECSYCKKVFEAIKETAKYCSDSCRVMYCRKNKKSNVVTPVQMQVLYNAVLEMVTNTGRPEFKGIAPAQNGSQTAISHATKQALGIEKTFQKHMNHIATLVFPDDKEDYILVIEAATNLSDKQKELLITNIKNSRF